MMCQKDVEGVIADLGVAMEFHTGRLKTLHHLTLCKTIVSGVNRFYSFCSQIILQSSVFLKGLEKLYEKYVKKGKHISMSTSAVLRK